MLEKGYSLQQYLYNFIESNSLTVVQLITEDPNEEHTKFTLVMDGKNLLTRTSHVFREANQCVDCLAHLGAEQLEAVVVMEEAPQTVCALVKEDALGVGLFKD